MSILVKKANNNFKSCTLTKLLCSVRLLLHKIATIHKQQKCGYKSPRLLTEMILILLCQTMHGY